MSDVADLESIYDAHAQALYGFLLNLTRNEADTRDLLQEVFAKLVRKPDLLRGVTEPRAFLLRLAHNAAIDLVRRVQARGNVITRLGDEPIFASTDDPDVRAFRAALTAALAELPIEQRAVVHLKLWEGFTFESIAETLDVPLNTAASRYRYGLDKLRERLRPLYDEINERS
jgi:RNA polymerase sigma-70 factor (ECF subfamily)